MTFGYTPGYLGALVSDGVVVYGTGYEYPRWIGSFWLGRPATYGLGSAMTNESRDGWTYAFGIGWSASQSRWGSGVSPWWQPLGWGARGERYPWIWRDGRAVRLRAEGEDRGVGAWRTLP